MGAGGNWLSATLAQTPMAEDHYKNFHHTVPNRWVKLSHSGPGLLFSGTNYFNFFVNHILKLYHYELNMFETKDYAHNWMTMVALGKGICKFNDLHVDIDADKLFNNPDAFYSTVVGLQKLHNKPIIGTDDFLYRREKFIKSCVNIDNMVENFDDMIWVAFVLGQLLYYNIYPSFPINELANQLLCKQFARENYHHCKLRNITNFNTQVFLPKFKN